MTAVSKFGFGDKVVADYGTDNPMVIVGYMFRPPSDEQYECSYWCNGDCKTVWLPGWRLAPFRP